MRKILFRGKILGGEKWVEGWLKPFTNGGYDGKDDRLCIQNGSHSFDIYEVDPKTVGQYTGLKDKNGTKIFEGDIIHCVAELDDANMVVIFENGEFRMILCDRYKSRIEDSGYYSIRNFDKEVIGNIYDNSELLKGNEKWD